MEDQPASPATTQAAGGRAGQAQAPAVALNPPFALTARLAMLLGLTLVLVVGFSVYERLALGLPPVREEPALFTTFHLARSALALLLSGLIVRVIVSGRAKGCRLDQAGLPPLQAAASVIAMAAALAWTGLFLLDPVSFGELAAEDGVLEWASALCLFAGSLLFAGEFVRRLRGRKGATWSTATGLLLAGSFSGLFFLIGMEEISWMQRIFGFQTPSEMAQLNWQGEFNLHNMQTDLSETAYYSGAGLFLILLPLMRDAGLGWPLLKTLPDFLPGRAVAAISAPMSIFNYGHWNLIPIQITAALTIFVLLAYAAAAARRESAGECLLFLFLAISVAAGQALFLAYGTQLTAIPDPTEFKEFFIAVGLAWFAAGATTRHRRREPPDDPGA